MANQKVRLTKSTVAKAQPREREYFLWDNRIAGFALRVRPSGNKSFVFVYRTPGGSKGRVRRVTIKAGNPRVAFERAKALAAQHHGGVDPAAGKAKEKEAAAAARRTLSVGAVLDRFIADHAKPELAPKTAAEYERIVERILKPELGSIPVDKLESSDVAAMRDQRRATPTQASQAVRVLSSAMSWAAEFRLRPQSPNPARIRLKAARRRTRLFSDAEVARLQSALGELEAEGRVSPPVALGIRLLFATGCRAGEICSLEWANVDLDEGLLRWPRSKTGFLEKPVTAEAMALLKGAARIVGGRWVCPSFTEKPLRVETLEAAFERTMKRAGVEANENATLHLVRHWFATRVYTDKSIPLPVQMAIVGHTAVPTAMGYAHVSREEMKRAAQAAAKRRASAVSAAGKRGKVVPLGASR